VRRPRGASYGLNFPADDLAEDVDDLGDDALGRDADDQSGPKVVG
jgi:hypothetical protein